MKVWQCTIKFYEDGFEESGLICEFDETPEGFKEEAFIWYGLNVEQAFKEQDETSGGEFKILDFYLHEEIK